MALTGNLTGTLSASMSAEGGVNGQIAFDGSGTDNYNELDNKPSINGVVLQGNKTSTDLHIESGGTDNYNDLLNKPQINGTTLTGDVSDTQLLIDYNHLINRPIIPDISNLENRMDTAETDIDNLQSDMTSVENDIDDISDDIATIKATDLVQNSDISSLKNRMTTAEGTISTHTSDISGLDSRLDTAEGTISTHTSDISGLDSRLDTAEGTISTHTSDISGLDSRLDTAEGDINSLEGIVGDGQQTVGTDLTDAVTQLKSSITNLIDVITITNISTDTNGNYVTSYDWVDGKYIAGYSYQTPGSGNGRWFMSIRPSAGNKIVCHAFADDNSRINRNDVCFVFYKINN